MSLERLKNTCIIVCLLSNLLREARSAFSLPVQRNRKGMRRYGPCYPCDKICVETAWVSFTHTPGLASIGGKMTRTRTGLFAEKPSGLRWFWGSRNEGQSPGGAPLRSGFNLRSEFAVAAPRQNPSVLPCPRSLPWGPRGPWGKGRDRVSAAKHPAAPSLPHSLCPHPGARPPPGRGHGGGGGCARATPLFCEQRRKSTLGLWQLPGRSRREAGHPPTLPSKEGRLNCLLPTHPSSHPISRDRWRVRLFPTWAGKAPPVPPPPSSLLPPHPPPRRPQREPLRSAAGRRA